MEHKDTFDPKSTSYPTHNITDRRKTIQMAAEPRRSEAEYAEWLDKQLRLLDLEIQTLDELYDGTIMMALLRFWKVENVPPFYKRKKRTLSRYLSEENRRMACDVLNREASKFDLDIEFSKSDVIAEQRLDALHCLYLIRRSIDASKKKRLPHHTADSHATEEAKVCSDEVSGPSCAVVVNMDSLSKVETPKGSLVRGSMHQNDCKKWNDVLDKRVLRVFICLDPYCMHEERTLFYRNAEKRLKDFASKNGVALVFVDVDSRADSGPLEDELSLRKRLQVIENCHYFLCALDSKYAAPPKKGTVKEWHPDTYEKYPYLRQCLGLSVTDYEINHGTLIEQPATRRAFFYSNDIESSTEQSTEQSTELSFGSGSVTGLVRQTEESPRERISSRYKIKPYKSALEFVDMAASDLMEAITEDFPPAKVGNPEDIAHLQLMQQRLTGLEGRQHLIDSLREKVMKQLENDNTDIVVVGAESGVGKSSVMSGVISQISGNGDDNILVIPHFVGCSSQSNYVENLIERVARILRENDFIPHHANPDENKDAVNRGLDYILRLASRTGPKKIVLAIDAINQLVDSETHKNVHRVVWLPKKTPKNVSIIVSTIDTHSSYKMMKSFGVDITTIPKMDDQGIIQATKELANRNDEKLDESQMQQIIENRNHTGHPLFLRVVLEKLKSYSKPGEANAGLSKFLAARGMIELIHLVIQSWENMYGTQLVNFSTCVLSLSRIGLNEDELQKYVEFRMNKDGLVFDVLTWKAFFYDLLESLFLRYGRYDFAHELAISSVEKKYLTNHQTIINETKEYGLWLLGEYGSETTDTSIMAEICYALLHSGQHAKLAEYLSNENVIRSMLGGVYRPEFFVCWQELNRNGFDHKSAYEEMTKQPNPTGLELVSYFCDVKELRFLLPILEHRISTDSHEGSKAVSLNILGRIYMELRRYQQALECHERSLEIRIKEFGKDHPDVATAYLNISTVYDQIGNHGKSLEYIHKSLEVQLEVYGEEYTIVATTYNNIGVAYWKVGRNETALEYHEKSLNVQLSVCGEYHPNVANAYYNIGEVYRSLERFESSLEQHQKCLDIRLKLFGEDSVHVASSYNTIGLLYEIMKKHGQALEYYEAALDIRSMVFGEKHADVAESYNNIGTLYDDLQKFDKALEFFQKSLKIRLEVFGTIHAEVAKSYMGLGLIYVRQSRFKDALETLNKASTIFARAYGPDHEKTKKAEQLIAFINSKKR